MSSVAFGFGPPFFEQIALFRQKPDLPPVDYV